ncbi:MAG: hypothetical protein WC707_05235 [Candidatus Babeliaceae bacterium]|jgi:hypothetical protein
MKKNILKILPLMFIGLSVQAMTHNEKILHHMRLAERYADRVYDIQYQRVDLRAELSVLYLRRRNARHVRMKIDARSIIAPVETYAGLGLMAWSAILGISSISCIPAFCGMAFEYYNKSIIAGAASVIASGCVVSASLESFNYGLYVADCGMQNIFRAIDYQGYLNKRIRNLEAQNNAFDKQEQQAIMVFRTNEGVLERLQRQQYLYCH